ncbi:hypothetical protein [Yersinia pseudotuberculosis]|uniref:hypothetical protein n=1 Tax=Yersinia pseudotuberculosis TaxID=633 RepID=UPI002B3091CA|nr:hypothetical protein YPSE1_05270 [Yersinia pseudotuberculosis]
MPDASVRIISCVMFNARTASNVMNREHYSPVLAGRALTPAHTEADQGRRCAALTLRERTEENGAPAA